MESGPMLVMVIVVSSGSVPAGPDDRAVDEPAVRSAGNRYELPGRIAVVVLAERRAQCHDGVLRARDEARRTLDGSRCCGRGRICLRSGEGSDRAFWDRHNVESSAIRGLLFGDIHSRKRVPATTSRLFALRFKPRIRIVPVSNCLSRIAYPELPICAVARTLAFNSSCSAGLQGRPRRPRRCDRSRRRIQRTCPMNSEEQRDRPRRPYRCDRGRRGPLAAQ